MSKTKKIILFIVEGITEEISFGNILPKLIRNETTKFHITRGDLTSDKDSTTQNIQKMINNHIKKFLEKYYIKKSDISKIIHLVDTDGAYISPDSIEETELSNWEYTLDKIKANNKRNVISRNDKKAGIMNLLSSQNNIAGIDYKAYYLSSNLEHVLHNKINVTKNEKIILAEDFEDRYDGQEEDFINFISNPSFAVPGDYNNTWQHIKVETNSLKRFSNFHLFFSNLK